MPAKGERNQSYYPSCWLNLANNPSIDAASYLNEATLGHQMEEPALRKLISLQSVWLIITNKVQLTTILKLSGCINMYFVKWRQEKKRSFRDKETCQFKPTTQLRVQLR